MKNIDQKICNSIVGKTTLIPKEQIVEYAQENGDTLINALFNLINEKLNEFNGRGNLEYLEKALDYMELTVAVNQDVNRKILLRKLNKLDEKIHAIKLDGCKNADKRTIKELENLENGAQQLQKTIEKEEPKNYEFISYLIHEVKNTTYIELAIEKLPSLVNAKDKDKVSLYRNILYRYIESLDANDEENMIYYANILYMLQSQKTFVLTEEERERCLKEIYRKLDQLTYNKKQSIKNKDKIERLDQVKQIIIKEVETIEELASKYHIPLSFEETLIEELDLYQTPITTRNFSNRFVVKDYIITIDGESALEIDDALSCRKLANGNYLLGVHIASILGYLPYESPLIEESFKRGTTIYLPRKYQDQEGEFHRNIPIFPFRFSSSQASLLPETPKLTRSYYYEISKDGEIVNQKFLKTIIVSNKKMTYTEVNNILENGSKNKKLQQTITNLQEVSDCLEKRFKPSKLYQKVKVNSEDPSELVVSTHGAQKIVNYTMLLTGNRVAEYFANSKEGYPCLYRVHEVDQDTTKKLESMVQNLVQTYGGDQYKKLYHLIRGVYPKGWYDLEGEHQGLGLKHYCHCTSGLRRSQDILIEHALETCYDKRPTDLEISDLEEEIKRRKTQVNTKTDNINHFMEDYSKVYQKSKRKKKN